MNINTAAINTPVQDMSEQNNTNASLTSPIMDKTTGAFEFTNDLTSAQTALFAEQSNTPSLLQNLMSNLQRLLTSLSEFKINTQTSIPTSNITQSNTDEPYSVGDFNFSNMTVSSVNDESRNTSHPSFDRTRGSAPGGQAPFNNQIFGRPEQSDTIGIHVGNDTFASNERLNNEVLGTAEALTANTGEELVTSTSRGLRPSDSLDSPLPPISSAIDGNRFSLQGNIGHSSRPDNDVDVDDMNPLTIEESDLFSRVEKLTVEEWQSNDPDTITFSADYTPESPITDATGVFQLKESGSAPPAFVARIRTDGRADAPTPYRIVIESPATAENAEINIPTRLNEDGVEVPVPFRIETISLPAEAPIPRDVPGEESVSELENHRRFQVRVTPLEGQSFDADGNPKDTLELGFPEPIAHPNFDNDITFRWGLYNNNRADGIATIENVNIERSS